MKKRITTITLLIALIAIIGSASLAYFTDSKTGNITANAGSVAIDVSHKIGEIDGDQFIEKSELDKEMVPGDEFNVQLTIKNIGNNPAKVRLKITEMNGLITDAFQEEGFKLQHESKTLKTYVDILKIGELDQFVAPVGDDVYTYDLKVELLKNSSNIYQLAGTDKSKEKNKVSFTYVVEALQDANTENTKGAWTEVGGGEILIP